MHAGLLRVPRTLDAPAAGSLPAPLPLSGSLPGTLSGRRRPPLSTPTDGLHELRHPRRSLGPAWNSEALAAVTNTSVTGAITGYPATVTPDWELRGFEPTDTVAHFDTLEGETIVQPSNRVCLYAPRFGSVRKVTGVASDQQNIQLAGVTKPIQINRVDDIQPVEANTQNLETVRAVATKGPVVAESEQTDGALSRKQGVGVSAGGGVPFENLLLLGIDTLEETDRVLVAEGVAAAIVWSDPQGVDVLLDTQKAAESVLDQEAEAIYTVDEPPACPKLRLIKCASTAAAKPGETVEFVIRFDNVGNQPIGNVVIADNLIGRLECDPESLSCTLPAKFETKKNESGSVVVRCELTDPLPTGSGGVLKFRCTVR